MISHIPSQAQPWWCIQGQKPGCFWIRTTCLASVGGTGCPRSLSISVLAADWPKAQGCRRSKGRRFDMTGIQMSSPPICTHKVHAGVWPCYTHTHTQKKHFLFNDDQRHMETSPQAYVRSHADGHMTTSKVIHTHANGSVCVCVPEQVSVYVLQQGGA